MACPTCDHTMHKIAAQEAIFWCPRCGTVKDKEMLVAADVPTVVKYVQHVCTECTNQERISIDNTIRESVGMKHV